MRVGRAGLGRRGATETVGGELWRAKMRAAGLESPRKTPDATVSSVFKYPYGTASRAVSAPSKCGTVALLPLGTHPAGHLVSL